MQAFFSCSRLRGSVENNYIFDQLTVTRNTPMPPLNIYYLIYFPGIFIIPYVIMLFLEGIPLVCVEIAIGQHFQDKFLLSTWRRIHPSTIGLGISAVFISFLTIVYFNVIVGWCASYFVYSLQRCLPWTSCPEGVEACTNSSSPSEYYWYATKLHVAEDINSVKGI